VAAIIRDREAARQAVRRLIQPLVVYDLSRPSAEWVEWEDHPT
jgi:hypothetical protein